MGNSNKVKGEVAGSFLLGISQSFANLNIFTEDILGNSIDSINPTKWYPYYNLVELLNYIKTNYYTSNESILFRAGVNFIQLWYEHGQGKQMINSGMDWLYANSESQGYNSVVRGENKNDIGWCNITSIDEKTGIVVYDNVTPLPSDLVKGIFYGGCFLFDDMEYVYIETSEDEFPQNPLFIKVTITVRFRVKSASQKLDLDSAISKLKFEDSLHLNSEQSESLVWQHKYLKFKSEIDRAYFKEMSKILSDVTNKSIEQSKELVKLNADKDRFISILGHDLKNPFNNILGFSKLLKESIHKYDIDKIEEFVTNIYTSAQITNNLLEDILMWARAQQGSIAFQPQTLNLSTTCENIFEVLKPSANAKGISMSFTNSDQINVYADANMLSTVLRNLVTNAIKFTNQGGSIVIKAERHPENVTISVSDNGVGIPPENLEKLFDISEVQTTKGTAGESGTGLGLLLCKEFVEKHGGRIWVESQEGKGSEFRFTLPTE